MFRSAASKVRSFTVLGWANEASIVTVLALALAGYWWSRWMCLRGEVARYQDLLKDLEHRATHDSLTGLPNRALLLDRMEHALALTARSRKLVALLYLDMDGFKEVNDAFGHEVGDRLLQLVAALLRRCVRQADTVARLGGDEFIILLEGLENTQEALRLSQRISEMLRTSVVLDGHRISISASIGTAVSTSSETTPKELLCRADAALYCAKSSSNRNPRVS